MLELLKNVRCFAWLDEKTLRAVEQAVRPERFVVGQRICTEGEESDRMYVIESGEVVVSRQAAAGESVELAVLGRGDIAGELGLFGQTRRTATLDARTECRVLSLAYRDFERVLEQDAAVARGLLAYVSAELVRSTSTIVKLTSSELDRRLHVAFFHASPLRNELYRKGNRHGYALHFLTPRLCQETAPLAAGCRVVVVSANDTLDAPVIEALHPLGVELVALRCAGFNNVDLQACQRLGIQVTRVPGYSPHAVAEHAVALMLALNRHIPRAHARVRDGNFSLEGLLGFDMHGRTAGIVGTGKIGSCVASILHGFGCRLLAFDVLHQKDLEERLGVRYVELDELFSESDVISLHAPLTPETHHLIDKAALEKMKPGVMLINTSRGGLVDTKALLDGLKSGKIGHAGLDVYEEEESYFYEDFSARVIADDVLARLLTFHNVLITSHQGSLTDVAQQNMAETTLANIREYELGRRGRDLTNVVLAPA
jgi:D-lactate dehydrogenase